MTASAPKLFASPAFQTTAATLRSSVLPSSSSASSSSGSDSSSSYVLGIVPLTGAGAAGGYAISTSAPSNAIYVVDGETLRVVGSLNGGGDGSGFSKGKGTGGGTVLKTAHEGGVTCLKTAGSTASSGPGLVSCGKEGSVVIWDTRSGSNGKVGVKMFSSTNGKPRALLSCDISANGWTVAAGSELQGDDAIISYWDPRNPTTPLRTHTSTHSDDVTVVSFAPPGYTVNPASSPGPNDDSEDAEMASASQLSEASVSSSSNKLLLLTGSTDGLLNVSDAYEEDEDEAVILTANWGCSIAQAGWVGEKGEGVWAGSDMETFSTWSSELDPILDFDIREPGVHGGDAQWVTDYLVGCHSPSASIPKLSVFVGSNEGDVALISTPHPLTKPTSRNRQPTSSSSSSAAPWYLQTAWTHQHVGVVRALYYDQQHQLVVTGGEDAKLHIWRDSTGGALYEGDDDVDMDVDDAAPTDDEELARRRVKSSRKRDSGSDEEDEAMDGKRRRR